MLLYWSQTMTTVFVIFTQSCLMFLLVGVTLLLCSCIPIYGIVQKFDLSILNCNCRCVLFDIWIGVRNLLFVKYFIMSFQDTALVNLSTEAWLWYPLIRPQLLEFRHWYINFNISKTNLLYFYYISNYNVSLTDIKN